MRRLIPLLAVLLSAASWADVNFATPHSTTSYYTPCFPIYSTASDGAATLTGVTGSTTSFIIYAQIDNTATDIEYETTADVETISTIGTYAAPTADTDIRFGECGTPGTYQLQPRNTLLATSGAKMITFKLSDGGSTMADQIVYLDLNVTSLSAVGDEVAAELATYDGPTKAELDTAVQGLDESHGTIEGKLDLAQIDLDSITDNGVSADIKKVNGIEIEGAGTTGDPWKAAD